MAVKAARHSPGFTLLELLAVIGVIAIMLVAVLPVVNSLAKSSGRKAAISNLASIIEQTRSLALSDGRTAYLAFVTTLPTGAPAALTEDYSYRAYAVFEDDANGVQKLQVTKWQKLPIGISFRAQREPAGPSGSQSGTCVTATTNTATAVFAFSPVGAGTTATCPFLSFDSAGTITNPPTAGPMRLVVFEGLVRNGSEIATAKEPSQQPVRDELQLGRYNGRARVVVR